MRFPRESKLKTKADFKNAFEQPSKITQRYLVALYKPNEKNVARLGIIAGKKVASSAVVRNKIKRIVRESFRNNKTHLAGLDIIVMARQQCDTLDKDQLRREIDKLWEKLLTQSRTRSS